MNKVVLMYGKVIQLYIYMYLFFFKFFSHLGYYRILSNMLVICFKYSSMYISAPNSQSVPTPQAFPAGNHKLFFYLKDFFFLIWTTAFQSFIEFVTILLLFYVSVFWPRGMWGLSSPTRD